MSNRFAQVILLAEDERSANFMRHYVKRALDVDRRQIRQVISPSGRGDAKQWVTRQYAVEVKELRRRHSRFALLVHLDADTESVLLRHRQLAESLQNEGLAPRQPDERISHVVPRRHTETWLCVLTGTAVDEERDCKRERIPSEPDTVAKAAAEQLYALTRPNAVPPLLPSLIAAIPELQRLER